MRLIFHDILKTDYSLVNNIEEFNKSRDPKINYSDQKLKNCIRFKPDGLLFETGIYDQKITITYWNEMPVFYQTSEDANFPFDPFAMTFFLVTRYEEYNASDNLDQHGRFRAEESIAFKNGFLDCPLINHLALKIREEIQKNYGEIELRPSNYQYISTFDVDMAFSYLGKGLLRNAGGFIRSLFSLQFERAIERLKVLMGIIPDPFNNFDFIFGNLRLNDELPIIFVNLGKYGRYDKNISFENLRFFRLLQYLNEKSKLSIHPSYASNSNIELLREEIAKLEHIKGSDVVRSRQHFLILKWPETYRNLLQLGIVEDYSMGYASQVGFRASICTPFRFYDLLAEEETALRIHPFAFMDGTMVDYMNLGYNEMFQLLEQLSVSVKKVAGDLIGIWHNSALAENKDLKKLFIKSLSIL